MIPLTFIIDRISGVEHIIILNDSVTPFGKGD